MWDGRGDGGYDSGKNEVVLINFSLCLDGSKAAEILLNGGRRKVPVRF